MRNDKITLSQIERLAPDAIVISPGPCTPDEAGCSLEVVKELGPSIPILGVCLGHQAIIQSFGGEVILAPNPIHGRSTSVTHRRQGVFQGVPSPFTVGRYHSLIGRAQSMPACLDITSETEDGIVMAVSHREHLIIGLQFHPESILTEHGYLLLQNFANLAGLTTRPVAGAHTK